MRKFLCFLLVLTMLLSVGCSAAVSVVGATINEDGHLILSMSDGSTIDAGYAKGDKGDQGEKGIDGKDGRDGIDGVAGVGIKKASVNDSGHLMIRLTDDTLIDTGYVMGADGKDGKDGRDGVDGKDGRDGQDGVDGEDGTDGKDGVDGITPHIGENGNWWIGEEDTGIKTHSTDFIYNNRGEGTTLLAYVGTDYDVTIPEKTKGIGEAAFRNNRIISSVTFPEGVTWIDDDAFNGCENLEKVKFPESLEKIGAYAFAGCWRLQIVLPESLLEIEDYAFKGVAGFFTCKAITPPIIFNNIFSDSVIPYAIYVPAASVAAYKAADIWKMYGSAIQAIP